MQHYASVRIINIVLAILAGLGLGSCATYDQPYGPGYTHSPPVASVTFYSYWYYPDIQVYFDTNRQVYFYFSNNHWVQTLVLPPPLRAHMGGYVPIQSRYTQPYIEHNVHIHKYPPHYREEHRPPQRHDEHTAPPGYNVPAPQHGYQTPYKQPPQYKQPSAATNESHGKSSGKDKLKDQDKNKQMEKSKDAKTRHEKDKQKAPVKKKKDAQDEQDKEQRDSR